MNEPVIIQERKSNTNGVAIFGVGLIAAAAYFFSKRADEAQKGAQQQQQSQLLQENLPTQQAALIRNAIAGVGTDEETLYKTAAQIKDWPSVAAAYSALTKGGNVEADLSDDLDADEYKYFMSLLEIKGRENVLNKGVIEKISTGNKPGDHLTLLDAIGRNPVNVFDSVKSYATGKPVYSLKPGHKWNTAYKRILFKQAYSFQWMTQTVRNGENIVIPGVKTILYEFIWESAPAPFKNGVFIVGKYNLVGGAKTN